MFPIVEVGSPALEGTTLPAFVVARGRAVSAQAESARTQSDEGRASRSSTDRQAISRLPASKKLPRSSWARSSGSSGAVYDRQQTEALVLLFGRTIASNCWVASAIDDIGLGPAQRLRLVEPAGRVPPGRHDPLARRLLGVCECDRRRRRGGPRPGFHVVVGEFYSGDGHRCRRRSSSTVIASASARARCSSGPGQSCPPPDEWLGESGRWPRPPRRKSWAEGPGAHAAARQDRRRWAIARPAKARRTPRTPRQLLPRSSGTGSAPDLVPDLWARRKERQMPSPLLSWLVAAASGSQAAGATGSVSHPQLPRGPARARRRRRLRT